ncbi:hypothetical protein VTI28DRAFT_3779 [Corynascus sepedonium]
MHWPPIYYLSAPGSLPRLAVLELVDCNPTYWFELCQLAALFRAAPSLQTVRCNRVWDMGNSGDWLKGVMSASVTFIEMFCSVLGPDPLASLLTACPRLETFKTKILVERRGFCEAGLSRE